VDVMRCPECGCEHGRLMDTRQIIKELGVSQSTAYAIMRPLRKYGLKDVKKVWVSRRDVYETIGGEP